MENQMGSKVDFINHPVCKNQSKFGVNNSSSQSFHTATELYPRNSAGIMDQIHESSVSPKKSKNGPSDKCKEIFMSNMLMEDKDLDNKSVLSKYVLYSNESKTIGGIMKNNNNSIFNGESNITKVSSPVKNDVESTALNPLSLDLLQELVPEVSEKFSSANDAHEPLCILVSDDTKPKNVATNFTVSNKGKHNLYMENDLDDILRCPQFIRTEKKHYSNDAVNLDELDMSLSKILNSAKTGSKDCVDGRNCLMSGVSNSKISNLNGDHTYHLPFPCVEENGINSGAPKMDAHAAANKTVDPKVPGKSNPDGLSVNKQQEALSENSKCLHTSTSADPDTQINSSSVNQSAAAAESNNAVCKVLTNHSDSLGISNLSPTSNGLTPNESEEVSSFKENILNGNTFSGGIKNFSSEFENIDTIAVQSDEKIFKKEENEEVSVTKPCEFSWDISNQPKSSTNISPLEGLNEMKNMSANDNNQETSINVNSSEGLKETKHLSTGDNQPKTSINFIPSDKLKDAISSEISENGGFTKEASESSCQVKSDNSKRENECTRTNSDDKCAVEKFQVLAPSFVEVSSVPDTSYNCNECGARLKTQNSLFTHKKMHLSVLAVTGLVNKRRSEETDKGKADTEGIIKRKRGRPKLNKAEGSKAISTILKENIPKKIRRTRAQASEKPQMKSKEIAKALKEGKNVNRGEPLKSYKNLRLRESVLTNKNKAKLTSKSEGLKSVSKNLSSIEAAKPDRRMKSYTPPITGNLMRKFACLECGSKFKRNDHLKRHQLLHSEKGFQCTQCDMKFYRGDKLKLHTLRHHTNVRAKSVAQAPKTVVHQSVLKVTKLPKRNVECQKCGFQFLRIIPPKTDKSGLSRRKNSCCISCGAKLPEDPN